MGLGLGLEIRRVNDDEAIGLPAGNRSVAYFVGEKPSRGNGAMTITLPPAASATSRYVTIQIDADRHVTVRAYAQESINGAQADIVLKRNDVVTFMTDGVEWVAIRSIR
jgi:hypothetical protein